jgi:hypothetical protein
MSEQVMLRVVLGREQPMRLRWLGTDGAPGDGYKAQVIAVVLPDGTRLGMHGSSVLEQTTLHGDEYHVTFTGMIGYAADHADYAHVEKLASADVDYEIDFVHEDGHSAPAGTFEVVEQPRALAQNLANPSA